MKFTPDVKRRVLQRSGRRCEKCGLPCNSGQFHHRRPRRMGGTVDAEVGTAANCLYLHRSCHAWVESRREQGYLDGHLLDARSDPTAIPALLWDGWFLLSPDGGLTRVEVQPHHAGSGSDR